MRGAGVLSLKNEHINVRVISGMTSIWSKRDEWDDKDFGRPVGRNMWKRVESGLESLKGDVTSEQYKDFVRATAGHAGTTKWAEAITSACNSIHSTKYKTLHSKAEFITRKLEEASTNVSGRFEMQKPVEVSKDGEDTYHTFARQEEEIKGKIKLCQNSVQSYIWYCLKIYDYVKKSKKIKFEESELCRYLVQNEMTIDSARNFCETVGAIFIEHLVYVEQEDIPDMPDKQKLESLVNKRKYGGLDSDVRMPDTVQKLLIKLKHLEET